VSRRFVGRLAATALVLGSTACGVDGLSFVRDESVEIVAPQDRSKVRLPFDVRWTADEVGNGSFGVFVDRAPQPPDETLAWFARDDEQCRANPGCPDDAYFTSRNIYRTSGNQVTVDRLLETRAEDEQRYRDLHEVVVVLLDERGRRIGESAFSVEFELLRESAGMERSDFL
jgi:hypothetical protein